MNKAIFLDRDGTLNEEVNYLKRPEEIKLIPDSIKALQIFKSLGYLNIIITNQSGVARGFISEEDLSKIHSELIQQLKEKDHSLIDDIFFSPFHPEGIIEKYKIESEDRKPSIGLIRKAQSKHDIDLTESFFIGDSLTDMLCAHNAGLKRILVRTGNGNEDYEKCLKENIRLDYYAMDLYDASKYIKQLQTII
ncbi:MAG: HAD family hydrolase [Ignavibacteria bacterium]